MTGPNVLRDKTWRGSPASFDLAVWAPLEITNCVAEHEGGVTFYRSDGQPVTIEGEFLGPDLEGGR